MDNLPNIKFYLCDINQEIVDSWKDYFGDHEIFYIHNINIIEMFNIIKNNINNKIGIISPANSFYDMQGGVDLIYYNYFGHLLEEEIQEKIRTEKYGELAIGDSLVINIPSFQNSYLIISPTMRVPMNISETINIYLAFRSSLISISKTNISHVLVPG